MPRAHTVACWTGALTLIVASASVAADLFLPNGMTRPSQRVELAVPVTGQVREVTVKPGDEVKAGQLLVQLDDTVEKTRAEALEVDANSDIQLKAAQAELEQKRVEEKRKAGNAAFSQSEQEEAKLAVTVAGLRVDLANQETKKKKAELQVQQELIKKMKLTSPVSGIVEKIDADVGEVVDPSKPSLVIVDNSKLDVEAPLPTTQVNKLKVGDVVEVRFTGETEVRQAKVTFLSPVAEASADMRLVRASMPNPDGRPAGMSVLVSVPEKPAAAR